MSEAGWSSSFASKRVRPGREPGEALLSGLFGRPGARPTKQIATEGQEQEQTFQTGARLRKRGKAKARIGNLRINREINAAAAAAKNVAVNRRFHIDGIVLINIGHRLGRAIGGILKFTLAKQVDDDIIGVQAGTQSDAIVEFPVLHFHIQHHRRSGTAVGNREGVVVRIRIANRD